MDYHQLSEYLDSSATVSNKTSDAIMAHFLKKYSSVRYENELMFIFNGDRKFHNRHHLIQLHQRNNGRVPYHTYHFVVITYVYTGKMTLLVEDKKIKLNQGDLIILDKYVPHSVLPTSRHDLGINIILSDDFFDGTLMKPIATDEILSAFIVELMNHPYTHTHYLLFQTQSLPLILNCIQNILCEHICPQDFSDSIIDDFIVILLTALTRSDSFHTNLDTGNLKMQTLLAQISHYIQDHYQEGSLEKMCLSLNFNPSYISKIVRQYTGKTFKQLVNDQRMNQAKILLQNRTLPISEIARLVGINNLTNFYHRFKEMTYLTPNEFRLSMTKH